MPGPDQIIVVGNFGDNVIEALKSSIDVEYIAEDGIMKTFVDQYVELLSSLGSPAQTHVPETMRRGT